MIDLHIEKARPSDIDAVAALYDDLNDYLAANVNYPGWMKGVYPTRNDAEHFFETDTLYVAWVGGALAGSFALTFEPEQNPVNGHWLIEAGEDEAFVIHVFAIHPNFHRHGVGSAMLAFATDLGRRIGLKSIRLDVFEHNLPAIKAYEKDGFQYIDTIDLGLGNRGLHWFRLYEKVLAQPERRD